MVSQTYRALAVGSSQKTTYVIGRNKPRKTKLLKSTREAVPWRLARPGVKLEMTGVVGRYYGGGRRWRQYDQARRGSNSGRPMSGWRWGRVVPFALIAFLAGAELAARLDDWLRFDAPLLTTPNATYDLILIDSATIRGRPFGRYLKIELNAAGFRGAPITPTEPPPGCVRVLVLGASESVVGGEAGGTEYSAFMQRDLAPHGCFDVQNAAISALHLARITRLWTQWGRRWGAGVVIVYPSPAFYLAVDAPEYQRRPLPPLAKPPWWASRALQRWSNQSF